MPDPAPSSDDRFTLYDLRVEVIATDRPMVCNHQPGDWFEVVGEMLRFPPGQGFPLYPLAALLPLLPAKQRVTAPADWMTTDAEVACPDPHCGGRFRIRRTGTSTFRHGEVTRVPLITAPINDSINDSDPLKDPGAGSFKGSESLIGGVVGLVTDA